MRMSQPGWVDVTRMITPGMPVYPGDPKPEIVTSRDQDGIAVSRIVMLTHIGTHLDLPPHVDARSESPSEGRVLRALNGRAFVLRVRGRSSPLISLATLRRTLREPPRRLLIRCDPSAAKYRGLTPEAARWLSGRTLLVGTDALSVDPPGKDLAAHRILLESGTLILENLLLTRIPEGRYHLMALPLRIGAPDGSPVRALVRPIRNLPRGGRS